MSDIKQSSLIDQGQIQNNIMSSSSPQPITAPIYHASMCQVSVSANDIILTLGRTRNFLQNGSISPEAIFEVISQIYLSPSSAKDLLVLLSETIDQYEKSISPIVTPHTKFCGIASKNDKQQ